MLSFSNKSNQTFLEKWLILKLEKKIYKITLDHCLVSKTKEVHTHLYTHIQSEYLMGTQESNETDPSGQSQNNVSNTINRVFDYNTKYTINIHDFVLI